MPDLTDQPQPSQFDVARQRAQQQNNAQVQSQQDALQRRFAAQGSLNSGAAIKQSELVSEQGAQNLNQANEGINAQENQQKYQEAQAQKQRDFTAQQNEAQRQFASGEAEKQRAYGTSERLGSEGFTAKQAGIAQGIQQGQWAQNLDLEKQKFGEDQKVNAANIDIANRVLDQKSAIEQILSPAGGFVSWASRGLGGGFNSIGNGNYQERTGGSIAGGLIGGGLF